MMGWRVSPGLQAVVNWNHARRWVVFGVVGLCLVGWSLAGVAAEAGHVEGEHDGATSWGCREVYDGRSFIRLRRIQDDGGLRRIQHHGVGRWTEVEEGLLRDGWSDGEMLLVCRKTHDGRSFIRLCRIQDDGEWGWMQDDGGLSRIQDDGELGWMQRGVDGIVTWSRQRTGSETAVVSPFRELSARWGDATTVGDPETGGDRGAGAFSLPRLTFLPGGVGLPSRPPAWLAEESELEEPGGSPSYWRVLGPILLTVTVGTATWLLFTVRSG